MIIILLLIYILLINILLKENDNMFGIIINFDEFLYLLIDNYYNNKTFEYIIPKHLKPRNDIPITNKYSIIKKLFDYDDYHIVIYYLEDYKCRIIIRNLYNYNIKKLQIVLENEIIYINSINENIYITDIITKTKLYKTNINYQQLIPKLIIQTGKTNKTNNLNAIMTFIDLNPEYEYIYFDNNDCINFIKNNFDKKVLNAFNKLVPGAYKADLFRYCVLYILGGCYFDNKQINRTPLREIIEPNQDIFLCNDIISNSYYNAFMMSVKNHKVIQNCINSCVKNIENNYYGTNPLEPTGPMLLYKQAQPYKYDVIHRFKQNYNIKYIRHKGDIYSLKKNKIICNSSYKSYYKYRDDNYDTLWKEKKIYNI